MFTLSKILTAFILSLRAGMGFLRFARNRFGNLTFVSLRTKCGNLIRKNVFLYMRLPRHCAPRNDTFAFIIIAKSVTLLPNMKNRFLFSTLAGIFLPPFRIESVNSPHTPLRPQPLPPGSTVWSHREGPQRRRWSAPVLVETLIQRPPAKPEDWLWTAQSGR